MRTVRSAAASVVRSWRSLFARPDRATNTSQPDRSGRDNRDERDDIHELILIRAAVPV
jgi:hypothetical protein